MAIRDLFWACPSCGRYGGLAGAGRQATCSFCGAAYRRVHGAQILVAKPDGTQEIRSPAEWEELLPAVDAAGASAEAHTVRPQAVLARWATVLRPVHYRGRLIGWAESFGPQVVGKASLDPESFMLDLSGQTYAWPFERITAVQPSSANLQINGAKHPLVSVRFLEDSVRRWEALLQRAIRERIRQLGRGEVAQFHPRIRCL